MPAHEGADGPPVASGESLGQLLEACRGYLLQIARQELSPALQAKGGASDLVQQTMLDAVCDWGRFQGTTAAELRAWLRHLLLNNLVSFARLYRETDKRAIHREEPLQAGLAADVSSPSSQAIGQEEAEAIRQGLQRLPEDYRLVMVLRYQEERTFEEIGQVMGLTPNAARKLWLRALKRLQAETCKRD